MRLVLGTITVLACAFPSFGFAKDFVFHNLESQNLMEVQVQNKTRTVQPVWILFYENEFLTEEYFEIPARSIRTLSLQGLKKPNWNFSVLSKSSQVIPLTGPAAPAWEVNTSTAYEMKIKSSESFVLNIFNLFVEKQRIKLNFFDEFGNEFPSEFTSAGFRKNLRMKITPPARATLLKISSASPLVLTSSVTVKPVVDTARRAPSYMKYFLVRGGVDGSTFVAPMDDPEMIRQARTEIFNPQGYIVFADIEMTPHQANRDFSTPEKLFWSWSVKKVTGLAQVGADWCQAYPEMIERMLHRFQSQSSVCFRGQRIIRELKPSEVESGILNQN